MAVRNEIADHVKAILIALGQDITREGLIDTPTRVADTLIEQCCSEDPELHRAFSEEKYDELVMVRNIQFASFCEHHMLPFWGVAHIAYLPNDKLLGISKLARLVYARCKGFQIQERITMNIAEDLLKAIDPYGVMVVIEASHSCISARGAKAVGSQTVTSAVRKLFKDNPTSRQECLSLMLRG